MDYDLIIYNGMILTVNADFEIIENGSVFIKNQSIDRIESGNQKPTNLKASRLIDAQGGVIMPGLVNTHTHLPMTLFRGLADDINLQVWLNEYIFPTEAKFLNPETAKIGSLVACIEMIMSGTTTCADGYFYEDQVAEAVLESGIRGVLGQGIVDFPAPGVPDPAQNIDAAVDFIEKWSGVSPRISPSIFCHSPYTCSPETLKRAKSVCREKSILFQTHVAETKFECDQIQRQYGASPVQHMENLGVLGENSLLVHMVWVDDKDIEILARRKTPISVATESEMKLASGIAPIPRYHDAGITVGLGTDGAASNNDLDMFQEMDFTAKLQKVCTLNPTVTPAENVVRMATIDGAKSIGLSDAIGSIEIGKQADIIVLETRFPHLTPLYHPASHIVYSACGSDVRDVVVAGQIVMENRCLKTLDVDDILSRMGLIADTIRNYKKAHTCEKAVMKHETKKEQP